MERLHLTAMIGKITTDTKQKEGGDPFQLTIMRIVAKTYKRSRKNGQWGDVDTWYEISAVGKEAESWNRFSEGDAIVLSGIPDYECYLRKDGTPGMQVYLQNVQDLNWTRGSKPREQDGGSQENTAYAGRSDTQVAPETDDDDVF